MSAEELQQLTLKPIGVIRTANLLKFDAPYQPNLSSTDPAQNTNCVIELFPDCGYEQALNDLSGFERIWLVWWFDRNSSWRPMVLPPRGAGRRRGVFATRAPYRPNPIGITSVPLISISGLKITVGSNDLLDSTPILDIKPYISSVDSYPDMQSGWLSEIENENRLEPRYRVNISDSAKSELDWLRSKWGIDFISQVTAVLCQNPTPHRTRRISRYGDLFRMGCGAWRVYFAVNGSEVRIERVGAGYPLRILERHEASYAGVPHREAQIAFYSNFGDELRKPVKTL